MTQESASYDAVIRRAMAKARELAAARQASAVDLAERLATASRVERRRLLKAHPVADLPDLVQHLLERAWELRNRETTEAVCLARRALEIALRAAKTFPRPAIAADLCADAYSYLANLERIQGSFGRAERLWRKAHFFLRRGTGDKALLVRFYDLQQSLKRSQRKFDEARDLLRLALRCQAELDDPHGEGKLHAALAMVHQRNGEPLKAFDEILRALELLDPEREPELHFRATHSSILYLTDLGRNSQGLLMAGSLEPAYELFGNHRFVLHGRWIKGRLHARCHERAEALEYLDSVRVGFRKEGLAYEAALSTLDLALVHAEGHDLRKVKQLVEEMYPVFVDKAIPREAAASLLLFADSARRSGATAAQVSKVIDQLHALRLH